MVNKLRQKFNDALQEAKERLAKKTALDELLSPQYAEEGDVRDNLGRLEVYHMGEWIDLNSEGRGE